MLKVMWLQDSLIQWIFKNHQKFLPGIYQIYATDFMKSNK